MYQCVFALKLDTVYGCAAEIALHIQYLCLSVGFTLVIEMITVARG